MREVKSKQIGNRGFTYTVSQFGAREGNRVLVRLLKILSGIAGVTLQQVDAKSLSKDEEGNTTFNLSAIGSALTDFSSKFSEEDLDWLVEKFIPVTEVSGGEFRQGVPLKTEGIFDLHFAGKYIEQMQWLAFAIEVNFSDFLPQGGIQGMVEKRIARQASPEAEAKQSPSTSPITSAQSGISGA